MSRSDFKPRWFANGPEGSIWTNSLQDAEKIMAMMGVDPEEWTVTDLEQVFGPPGAE